jgi:hypothetical protein
MSALRLTVSVEKLEFAAPFRITGFVFEHQDAVVVTLDDGRHRGRGEASGVFYLDDRVDRMAAAIAAEHSVIERGSTAALCRGSSRRAARAMRSTARCGSWKPSVPAGRCGRLQGCRRLSPC